NAEADNLLAHTWVHAAGGFELPNPGDCRPVNVAGLPLLLVRQRDGVIKGFHNVCRHRGSRLVREAGNVKAVMTCPYHGWAFGLDGALRSTPYWDTADGSAPPEFDASAFGLRPVRVTTWCDQVFVCLDDDAPSFEEHAEPLIARWAHADLSLLRFAGCLTYEVEANWKFVIENFLDTYHLPFLHKQLGSIEPAKRFKPLVEETLIGIHYTSGAADKNKGDSGFQVFPGFTAEQLESQDVAMLFPNTLFEFVPEHVLFFRVEPVSPGLTRESLALYFLGDDATSPELEDDRQTALQAWDAINRQDFPTLADLQAASHSPAARGLPAPSPLWELPSAAFRDRVDRIVGEA
ncbi:MAG: SRPBCC family protein, partial [Alphaproteobacteria bacterium]|nr:SRPBCC family protein [Alphaproteobacteria bacterium]